MYVVTRVKGSHWLLKWLPPHMEKKSPMPVVIEWLYRCPGGLIMAL